MANNRNQAAIAASVDSDRLAVHLGNMTIARWFEIATDAVENHGVTLLPPSQSWYDQLVARQAVIRQADKAEADRRHWATDAMGRDVDTRTI